MWNFIAGILVGSYLSKNKENSGLGGGNLETVIYSISWALVSLFFFWLSTSLLWEIILGIILGISLLVFIVAFISGIANLFKEDKS